MLGEGGRKGNAVFAPLEKAGWSVTSFLTQPGNI
jgi:hypothetical protein